MPNMDAARAMEVNCRDSLLASGILELYVKGLVLIAGTACIYCLAFTALQFAWFKNDFVFSLVKYKKK